MLLAALNFLKMSFADILDILLIALVIFYAFRWMRGTSALSIFIAIVSLFVIKVIVSALGMKMMTELMSLILDVGMLALIVIFQPEIRRFLTKLGQRYTMNAKTRRFLNRFIRRHSSSSAETVNEIAQACEIMSQKKTGALIVIARDNPMEDVIATGDVIDAKVCQRLLMNLFFKNSPLHDGAVIINGDRIVAARCTLPMSDRQDLPPQYGMRHKAAVGVSEQTDADVVVVSEETGEIIHVRNGRITVIHKIGELVNILTDKTDMPDGSANTDTDTSKKTASTGTSGKPDQQTHRSKQKTDADSGNKQ